LELTVSVLWLSSVEVSAALSSVLALSSATADEVFSLPQLKGQHQKSLQPLSDNVATRTRTSCNCWISRFLKNPSKVIKLIIY
jgi:hypothetical protein